MSSSDHARPGTAPGGPANEPGQVFVPGLRTAPRLASTVIVLRDGPGDDPPQVLLTQRNPAARFMGGAWVFPGGAVDPEDGDGDAGHRAAAVRELDEEVSIGGVAPDGLVPFSRWITPEGAKVRFDTWFFLAVAPEGAEPRIDGEECVDVGWFDPAEALRSSAAGERLVVFPTLKHLEQLVGFDDVASLVDDARGRDVQPVLPKAVIDHGETRILLPGDEGYDAA